jgi:hypothetical protein
MDDARRGDDDGRREYDVDPGRLERTDATDKSTTQPPVNPADRL